MIVSMTSEAGAGLPVRSLWLGHHTPHPGIGQHGLAVAPEPSQRLGKGSVDSVPLCFTLLRPPLEEDFKDL